MATKSKLKDEQAQQQERIEATVSKTEQFYNDNKKAIWSIVIAVAAIFLLVLAYNQFIYEPKVAEAQEQMFPAESSFAAGEYELALNGDGNVLGFAEIAQNYGKKAGASVYFYAGVCELQLGNFQSAINYFKKYNGKDKILAARALACTGDAYVALEDYNSALSYFDKAANVVDNMFAASYLLKAGVVCEEMGNTDKALSYYKTIKDKYPQSIEGYDVDKYISRIENK